MQKLCYTFDPASRTYVFQVNRILLAVTGVFVLGFLGFLGFLRKAEPGDGEGGGGMGQPEESPGGA